MSTPASPCAVRTACPYCGVGCGVVATAQQDGAVTIEGDTEHPANFGKLCSKGSALGETLSLEDRLLYPQAGGKRVEWNAALDLVAKKFSQTIRDHGPESVAFYVSGQILTEDYYVANKLMKGFIGAANIDTNSRLCMASSVAGHRRAFGADTVPGHYGDIEEADLVILTGSNLAWCHPVLFQRLLAAREKRGTKIVVIDPRETATTAQADLHLALKPGADVHLFNGLLAAIHRAGAIDAEYVSAHTSGFEAAIAAALNETDVARATGLAPAILQQFYRLFVGHERALTIYSQGVNQSSSGTDKVNAIINCHLATGRIGKPGMGPFSVTGQPNAMGGREVGGLANMLAAHMDIGDAVHTRIVSEFWGTENITAKPGLKAVDMFRAVGDGRIRALWIMGTNPVVSMPEADKVRRAIEACPFVVVSDVTAQTDTARLAHVLLPALAWGEKNGTVTNSERRITRQRAFLPAPGEARADWRQICGVAIRMGFAEAFAFTNAAEIFAEHAALSGHENGGSRDFDISAYANIDEAGYESLQPIQWPQPHGAEPRETRFFANGEFYTPDHKARFIPVSAREPASRRDKAYPLVLNTGRIRDQWHTMTRTSKAARLMAHMAEPFVEVSPADARARGLSAAGLAVVESRHGRAVLRVLETDRQPEGALFAPMHWTGELASEGRIDALMEANTDPHSGQPELKFTPVSIRPFAADWYGFAVSEQKPFLPENGYWALARARAGWRLEIASKETDKSTSGKTGGDNAPNWHQQAREILSCSAEDELLAYHDSRSHQYRFAAFAGERLKGLLFISPAPAQVSRSWAADQIGKTFDTLSERLKLLAGRAGADTPDKGAIICSCFEVGLNQIATAAVSGAKSVDAIGQCLKAGTNCGSCRTEIARIIATADLRKVG